MNKLFYFCLIILSLALAGCLSKGLIIYDKPTKKAHEKVVIKLLSCVDCGCHGIEINLYKNKNLQYYLRHDCDCTASPFPTEKEYYHYKNDTFSHKSIYMAVMDTVWRDSLENPATCETDCRCYDVSQSELALVRKTARRYVQPLDSLDKFLLNLAQEQLDIYVKSQLERGIDESEFHGHCLGLTDSMPARPLYMIRGFVEKVDYAPKKE